MSDVLARCIEAFGAAPPHRLFYNFEHALRFELAGDEEGSVPRFLKAHGRASTIASAVFAGRRDLVCLLSYFSETATPERKYFDAELLERFAINPSSVTHLGGEYSADDEAFRQWVQIDPSPSPGVVLWSAMGADLNIEPNMPGWLYLVDLERRLIVHPYDDRGMDVYAMDLATLAPLYQEFSDWLLDYDRDRIDAVFAT